jgi:hypothetical protein
VLKINGWCNGLLVIVVTQSLEFDGKPRSDTTAICERCWRELSHFCRRFLGKSIKNEVLEVVNNLEGQKAIDAYQMLSAKAETTMQSDFERLEGSMTAKLERIKLNKYKAIAFQKSQFNKLGIDNIRQSRLQKLEKETLAWERDFAAAYEIAADLSCLMLIRLDA